MAEHHESLAFHESPFTSVRLSPESQMASQASVEQSWNIIRVLM